MTKNSYILLYSLTLAARKKHTLKKLPVYVSWQQCYERPSKPTEITLTTSLNLSIPNPTYYQ